MTPILIMLALALSATSSASAEAGDHGASLLNGDRTVDLRPANDAPAYIKSMKLDITP